MAKIRTQQINAFIKNKTEPSTQRFIWYSTVDYPEISGVNVTETKHIIHFWYQY